MGIFNFTYCQVVSTGTLQTITVLQRDISWLIRYCAVSYLASYLIRGKEFMKLSLRNLQVRMSGGKANHLTVLWLQRRPNPGSKPAASARQRHVLGCSFVSPLHPSFAHIHKYSQSTILCNVLDDQVKRSGTFLASLFLHQYKRGDLYQEANSSLFLWTHVNREGISYMKNCIQMALIWNSLIWLRSFKVFFNIKQQMHLNCHKFTILHPWIIHTLVLSTV
jgi:hypothetical protein